MREGRKKGRPVEAKPIRDNLSGGGIGLDPLTIKWKGKLKVVEET